MVDVARILGFEAIVVFLAGLVIYGLRALPEPIAPWWGIVAGAVVGLAMFLTSGLLRRRSGFVIGWVLQVVVALGAFVVPAILFVALVFGGMWAYATIGGGRIERRIAAQRAAHPRCDPPPGSRDAYPSGCRTRRR